MSRLGRPTIALYNSYDPVKFREAHRRALARAGPLALAFDMNLATIGFPFPEELQTPGEISDWIATTTSIGEHGEFLKELTNKGRFQTFPYPNRGFPPQLGNAILMTRKPNPNRRIEVDDAVSMLQSGQSIMIIFGLGPRGVPRPIFEMCRQHMDITSGGFSLETCTAMGAVIGIIAYKLRE
ncbi:MAG: DUF531 family protein [Euryarchaeota archaeon]|nr:DUF531 family protein [Euryarchaeota archaeon]